jgi:hypothetical protein
LDTRKKILPWTEFVDAAGPVVAGFFDPLTADHSKRLEEIASHVGPVRVALYDPPQPLLPAEARAALVAALRCVYAVSIAHDQEIIDALDLRVEDLERRQQIIAHIHEKHGR